MYKRQGDERAGARVRKDGHVTEIRVLDVVNIGALALWQQTHKRLFAVSSVSYTHLRCV